MHNVMNRHLAKLSRETALSAPPDAGGSNGAGTENGAANDDSNSDGNEGGNDDEDGTNGDDDLSAALGLNSDADDDTDFDFGAENTEYQASDEEIEASKQLGLKIKADLESYTLDDADIPADFNPNDRDSVKILLINSNRKAIASSMQMMIPVINHALGTASKQMKHHMDSKASGSESRSKAVNAFKELGLSDPAHVTLGKTVFQQAMRANKNDHAKAAKATKIALKSMGIEVSGKVAGNRGGNSQNNNSGFTAGVKTGGKALDDMFGLMPK